ncbi:MAG: hypothetical protein IIY07_00750, partial [Thermoguttaceae bacterium]|nr:hypothetical protein [Thermoguttaceae bacterium]
MRYRSGLFRFSTRRKPPRRRNRSILRRSPTQRKTPRRSPESLSDFIVLGGIPAMIGGMFFFISY